MKKFTIDIVFPFYKDYNFLDISIKQINNQTYKATRLIFVDDNNNNKNLLKTIRKKLNKQIKLIFIKNNQNLGTEKSISKALKKVNSEYTYICSADDIIYKNFFQESIKSLKENKKSPFVFSNICINNLINKKKYKLPLNFINEGYNNKRQISHIFKKYHFKIYHNTVLFRSKYLLKNHLFDDNLSRRVDMLNLLFLSMKFGFAYLNKNLSEFTIRRGQYSYKKLDNEKIERELYLLKKNRKKFFNFLIKNNLYYEISPIIFLKKKGFKKFINFKYLKRYYFFKIWKIIRFIIPHSYLSELFRIFK